MQWQPTEAGGNLSSIVKFYTVETSILESEVWTSCAVVAKSFCKVQNLSPGTLYSFRIIAHGEGSTRSKPSLPSESLVLPLPTPTSPTTTSPSTPTSNGHTSTEEFSLKYKESEELAKGRFSVVHKCLELCSGEEFAVKLIPRHRWKRQLILKEYQILKAISHVNVSSAKEFCDTPMYSAIVMQFVRGSGILEYLCEQDHYMEYSVACLMQQLFLALEHIHSLEIAHLDIEVINVLILFFIFSRVNILKLV
jgi:hypothetical protein